MILSQAIEVLVKMENGIKMERQFQGGLIVRPSYLFLTPRQVMKTPSIV